MTKLFRISGYTACFAALLVMLGGHWALLQSVAWTRMAVAFSQQDSLSEALVKTFDGQHPCPMCLKIRDGREQDKEREQNTPLIKMEKMPEFILSVRQTMLPFVAAEVTDTVPTVPRLHDDFIQTPPTPPPRFLLAVL